MNIKSFYVDSKQPSDFTYRIQNAFPQAQVKNLGKHSGDLLIELDEKLVAMEVKEVPQDFVASIADKRLFQQSEGIRFITPWSFLLLSDDFRYDSQWRVLGRTKYGYGPLGTPERPWNREHIDGAITAVQARGVMVRYCYKGYVETIKSILRWAQSADAGAITQETIKLSPFDRTDQQIVNLLAWFDGIGVVQSKNFITWAEHKLGKLEPYQAFSLATTFFDGGDKPVGWTNHTIQRNRDKLGYPKETKPKTEWKEELDELPD